MRQHRWQNFLQCNFKWVAVIVGLASAAASAIFIGGTVGRDIANGIVIGTVVIALLS